MKNEELFIFGQTETHEVARDLELFRRLRSFCAHDLRSELGAVVGLLEMIADPTRQIRVPESHLVAALKSSRQALDSLDQVLLQTPVEFPVVWILSSRALTLDKTPEFALVRTFSSMIHIKEEIQNYRPHVLVLEGSYIGESFPGFVRRIGPHFVKIVVVGHLSEKQKTFLPAAPVLHMDVDLSQATVEDILKEFRSQQAAMLNPEAAP